MALIFTTTKNRYSDVNVYSLPSAHDLNIKVYKSSNTERGMIKCHRYGEHTPRETVKGVYDTQTKKTNCKWHINSK